MTAMMSEAMIAVARSVELSLLAKATLVMGVGLTAAWLSRRARASVRHLGLSATFVALIALPAMWALAPAMAIHVPVVEPETVAAVDPGASTPRASAAQTPLPLAPKASIASWTLPSPLTLVRSVWAAGATFVLCSLGLALWRLTRLRRRALPWIEGLEQVRALASEAGVGRPVEIVLHEAIVAPFTCGFRRPAIVLPADAPQWDAADLRRAVLHELEHVRRGDWLMQLIARVACAIYWFHPLVWVSWRRLGLEAERACDDAVVQRTDSLAYAEQLVSLAQRMSVAAAPVLGMANRSDLSTRVSALLDQGQPRGRAGMWSVATTLAVTAVAVSIIAPLHAVAVVPGADATVETQTSSPAQTKPGKPVVEEVVVTRRAPRRSGLVRALFEAAEQGDLDEINELINAGADVNGTLPGDGSALIAAARHNHFAAARLLLDRGAKPDLPVEGDGSPLIAAAGEGDTEIVGLLLDRGASIDQVVPGDENALIQASANGHLPVVRLLVTRGADVNARVWVGRLRQQSDGEWRTPLSQARKGGHTAVVEFLISKSARE